MQTNSKLFNQTDINSPNCLFINLFSTAVDPEAINKSCIFANNTCLCHMSTFSKNSLAAIFWILNTFFFVLFDHSNGAL